MNITNKNHQKTSGFTIVELLVVIVVIGILAALSIVSYTGITQRAAAVTLKSDLKNSSTKLALYNTTNSIYPADLTAATTANVLPKSPDTTYQYTLTGTSYCLSATSTKAGSTAYHYSSLVGTIEDGVCSGHRAPGVVSTVIAEVLVVAGGGGGGSGSTGRAAGGGAGGVLSVQNLEVPFQTFNIVVGGGGLANNNGQNSSFYNLTAIGGGGGADYDGGIGQSGGSAGGGWYSSTAALGTVGQGNNGGLGYRYPAYGGGGGGGAGAKGQDGTGGKGGDGGNGIQSAISGTLKYYSGGGSSDTYNGANYSSSPGIAGLGGGGAGNNFTGGSSGVPNTGGGGGSGNGSGGSGIVIIRYLTDSMIATGGVMSTSDNGAYTIHTFTSNGTFTVN